MCAGVLPGLHLPLQSCCLVCAHHGRHAEVALRTIAVVPCLQILLEKGVKEDKILFLSLIAAPEGIHKICAEVRQLGSALLTIPGKDVDARGIAADFVQTQELLVSLCCLRLLEGRLLSWHAVMQYPRVRVITSEIDNGIGDNFQVVPGVGGE